MVKNFIIIILVIGLLVGVFVYFSRDTGTTTDSNGSVSQESIVGCYVAKKAQDIYTLKIDSQSGDKFAGSLRYKNFQKDSSSGTFTGTYKDGILLGFYSFDSEGMHSESGLAFKKVGDTFIQGFGDITTEGEKIILKDLSNVSYDPSINSFNKSATCE